MKLDCIKLLPDFSVVREVEVSENVFTDKIQPLILKEVVEWQLMKKRAISHSIKGISDVSGTTARPYRQKGTGRARHGSLRSVQFRGGGNVFGPVAKDYSYKLPKKTRKLALKMALSQKLLEKKLMVFEMGDIPSPSTKLINNILKGKKIDSLVVFANPTGFVNFNLSIRNLKNINFINISGVNVYDILNHDYVLFSEESCSVLEAKFNVD